MSRLLLLRVLDEEDNDAKDLTTFVDDLAGKYKLGSS